MPFGTAGGAEARRGGAAGGEGRRGFWKARKQHHPFGEALGGDWKEGIAKGDVCRL